MANIDPQFVVTGEARLSYVHLFQPRANQNDPTAEPKYGVTLLIPKSDAATFQRIQAALQVAIEAGVSGCWKGARPPQPSIPIHDGDGLKQTGLPYGDECKGHWVIEANSKQAPQVVDMACNPILNQSEVYSGMYGRVSFRLFPYNNRKIGIGCGLRNVQKTRDGEPLGGRTNANEDFGGGGYVPQPVPGYPQQQAYPQQQPAYQPAAAPMGYAPGAPAGYQTPVAPAAPVGYPAAVPVTPVGYPQQQPAAAPGYPQQPQLDPITGKPYSGGVMGI